MSGQSINIKDKNIHVYLIKNKAMQVSVVFCVFLCLSVAYGRPQRRVPSPCDAETAGLEALIEEMDMRRLSLQFPDCDADGFYSHKQCRGRFCYCVDRENGQQINSEMVSIDQSAYMNCKCAVDRHEYIRKGMSDKAPDCRSNGNY